MNQVVLIGNVGVAPEIRTTSSGTRLASLRVATHRRSTGRDGQERDRTDWHRVVAWDRLAEIVERHVSKGDRIYVEGRLEDREWQDRSGRTRHVTEVVARELVPLGGSREPPAAGGRADWRQVVEPPEAVPARPGRTESGSAAETGESGGLAGGSGPGGPAAADRGEADDELFF